MRIVLALLGACFGLLALFNALDGRPVIALAEFGMACCGVLLLIKFRSDQEAERWALPLTMLLGAVILLVFWRKPVEENVFFWIMLMPVVSYLLLGRYRGLRYTAVFMTLALAISVYKFSQTDIGYSLTAVFNVVLCSLCIFTMTHAHEKAREQVHRQLTEAAVVDPLTGLINRAGLSARFFDHRASLRRHRRPGSLILLDLDHFKAINDSYGHAVGDRVLIWMADLFDECLREMDAASRIGGEEFALLLPDADERVALLIAERLRGRIAAGGCEIGGQRIKVTATMGVTPIEQDDSDISAPLMRADALLYRGKRDGRDRVVSNLGSPDSVFDNAPDVAGLWSERMHSP